MAKNPGPPTDCGRRLPWPQSPPPQMEHLTQPSKLPGLVFPLPQAATVTNDTLLFRIKIL